MGRRDKTIVGLDIGSTKVCTLIAATHNGGMESVGFGKVDSKGLKKGVVVNLEATVEAIKRSVHEAELMAGVSVDRVWSGIGGEHIESGASPGVVAVGEDEITRSDLRRVHEVAQAVALLPDQELLHAIPQEYVYGQVGVDQR